MKYCYIQQRKVYSCDHDRCRNGGSTVRGMKWCKVMGRNVYSCDHADCN